MSDKIKLDGVCFKNADAIRSFGSIEKLIQAFPGVDPKQLKKVWNDISKAAAKPTIIKPAKPRK
jgi:hypothetical protein